MQYCINAGTRRGVPGDNGPAATLFNDALIFPYFLFCALRAVFSTLNLRRCVYEASFNNMCKLTTIFLWCPYVLDYSASLNMPV